MANKLYDESAVSAIATAIRGKNGTATQYKIADMAAAIATLPSAPSLYATGVVANLSGSKITITHNLGTQNIVLITGALEDGTAAEAGRIFMFYSINPACAFDLTARITMPSSYSTVTGVRQIGEFSLSGPFGGNNLNDQTATEFSTADNIAPSTYGITLVSPQRTLSNLNGGMNIQSNNTVVLECGAYFSGTYRWRLWARE